MYNQCEYLFWRKKHPAYSKLRTTFYYIKIMLVPKLQYNCSLYKIAIEGCVRAAILLDASFLL